jgi:hypothetical protein
VTWLGCAVASLNYLIPVVAIVFAWAYLDERPLTVVIGGGALCSVARWPGQRGWRVAPYTVCSKPPSPMFGSAAMGRWRAA